MLTLASVERLARWHTGAMFEPALPEISVTQIPDDGYLIDVREEHEWAGGHAPTAVFLPMSQIAARVAEVPRDRTVYLVCAGGVRSAEVGQWLAQQGFEAVNVSGGMMAWAGAGLPIVT